MIDLLFIGVGNEYFTDRVNRFVRAASSNRFECNENSERGSPTKMKDESLN